MTTATKAFRLPYEPDYTEHWKEERRHQETKDWLRRREKAITSPSMVPDHADEHEAA
jgi:hypothetical protein